MNVNRKWSHLSPVVAYDYLIDLLHNSTIQCQVTYNSSPSRQGHLRSNFKEIIYLYLGSLFQ